MADNSFSSIASPAAGAYTVVHTVPGSTSQLANIRLVNRDMANGITVDVAICPGAYAGAAPDDADYIEPKSLLMEGGGIVENLHMWLAPGEKVVVRTSAATLSTRVHGFKAPNVVVSKLAVLANGLWQTVHTVGAGKSQTLNVRATNLDAAAPITVGLALCQPGYANGTAPPVAAYIEPSGQVIEAGGLIEDFGMAAVAGEKLAALTNAATLAVRVAAVQE